MLALATPNARTWLADSTAPVTMDIHYQTARVWSKKRGWNHQSVLLFPVGWVVSVYVSSSLFYKEYTLHARMAWKTREKSGNVWKLQRSKPSQNVTPLLPPITLLIFVARRSLLSLLSSFSKTTLQNTKLNNVIQKGGGGIVASYQNIHQLISQTSLANIVARDLIVQFPYFRPFLCLIILGLWSSLVGESRVLKT